MRTVSYIAGLVLAAAPLAAQTPALQPGDHVRWEEGGRRVAARVVALDPVRVRLGGGQEDRILSLDLPGLQKRLRPSRKGRGVFIGAGTGALVGAVIGYASVGDDASTDCPVLGCSFMGSPAMNAVAGAVVLGSVGAIIGFIAAPGAKWATLGAEPSANRRVSLNTEANRIGIRMRF
jgi:hypothetical protein